MNFSQFFKYTVCALLLSACEYSLIEKPGSEHLIESKRLMAQNADILLLKNQYEQAYLSSNQDVKREAAYNLASIEKDLGNNIEHMRYLEEAFALGYSGSKVSLANAYVDYNGTPEAITKAKAIYKEYTDVSATANIGLMDLAIQEGNVAQAQTYAAQAKDILIKDINNTNDFDGAHSYNLAKLYDTYYKDPTQAEVWYRKSLESGNIKAAPSLVNVWQDYNLVEQNKSEIITLANLAAKQGDSRSMKLLARSYAEGVIVEKDLQTAIYWYEQKEQAETSLPVSDTSLQLARLYQELNNFEKAQEKYQYSASLGNDRAVVELAKMLVEINPSPVTNKQAFDMVMPIALKNDETAMKYIADSYSDGRGVTQNYVVSKEWYQKIVGLHGNEGNSYQHKIDNLDTKMAKVKNGTSNTNKVKSSDLKRAYEMVDAGYNVNTALDIFNQLAVQKESLEAMLMVDSWNKGGAPKYNSYYKNEGEEKVYSRVKKHAKRFSQVHPEMIHRQWVIAANNGSNKAMQAVAENYVRGHGIGADDKKAKDWYLKAANAGNGEAMLYLANQLQTDVTNSKSAEEAFKWHMKAAQVGEVEGQYKVGVAYARGQGVAKDINKAKIWLNKANDNGYELANKTFEALKKETE